MSPHRTPVETPTHPRVQEDETMARKTRWSVAGAALALLLAGPALAATPAQNCESNKNKEAGKYSSCRQKAESKFALDGDATKRTAALQKCLTKYAAKWPALEAKALGACPTNGDQTEVRDFIDTHTDAVAAALAGGPLPDCPGDLATCEAGLDDCTGERATCVADLATCSADLTTCQGELAPVQTSLATCSTDLDLCQAELIDCLSSGGAPAQLLRTGQTTCWDATGVVVPCAGTQMDGELQRGTTRSYVDNGDGTITDLRTGLMWEKLSDDGSVHDKDARTPWVDAFGKITTLNAEAFAGPTDWRIPNGNELQSLADYGTSAPSIAAVFHTACAAGCTVLTCSCTPFDVPTWTSTSAHFTKDAAIRVSFLDGLVSADWKRPTSSYHVRAVRGGLS
jgi:hypothetical protein